MESDTRSRSPLGPYRPTLILHGGAGDIKRSNLPPDLYAKYHASLLSYVTSTRVILFNGGTAIDAACHAVTAMEDNPLFNCGRGSVFTTQGEIEMEASLAVTSIHDGTNHEIEYEGKTKRSAAVSLVKQTRHPILLAREVLRMGDEEHGMGGPSTMHGHLSGRHIEEWGWRKGLEKKEKGWFWTKKRWDQHRRGLKKGKQRRPTSTNDEDEASPNTELYPCPVLEDEEQIPLDDSLDLPSQGTVGAVCMDSWGVIAVATSTGGLTNKLPGRIGDTPTVGAGFWAESWKGTIGNRDGLDLTYYNDNNRKSEETPTSTSTRSLSERLVSTAKSELNFWVGDCFAPHRSVDDCDQKLSKPGSRHEKRSVVEKQPAVIPHPQMTQEFNSEYRRAVAMSGTGNGDSFLRTNACRSTAAGCRYYSVSPSSYSLPTAIKVTAGPGGDLQKSAGERWGKTGEGEGGIIGIELISGIGSWEGKVAFNFNCGGLWRAYFEKDKDGNEKPVVMVFRDAY